jgi:hypothetical protein
MDRVLSADAILGIEQTSKTNKANGNTPVAVVPGDVASDDRT